EEVVAMSPQVLGQALVGRVRLGREDQVGQLELLDEQVAFERLLEVDERQALLVELGARGLGGGEAVAAAEGVGGAQIMPFSSRDSYRRRTPSLFPARRCVRRTGRLSPGGRCGS